MEAESLVGDLGSPSLPDPAAARTLLVVPCYNEAARLDRTAFLDHLEKDPTFDVLFVDDGSSDGTAALLDDVRAARPTRATVLSLERNRGKAEAVRLGLGEALRHRPAYVGFWDADLSTPLDFLALLRRPLEDDPEVDWVFGSRVALLGHRVERRLLRHYIGRVFATTASAYLRLPVYDTQCGAKLFRANRRLAATIEEPFVTGWIFDVELLRRLAGLLPGGTAEVLRRVREVPLPEWRDVPGSKLKPADSLRIAADLARLVRRYGLPG